MREQRRLGEGVRRWVAVPSWEGLADYLDAEREGVPFVPLGHAQVPRRFTLAWMEADPDEPDGDPLMHVQLLFEVDEGQVELRSVLSWPMEVTTALELLRREQSMDQWKRQALMYLMADSVTWLDEKINGPATQEERSELVTAAIQRAAGLPIAKRGNRITDAQLEEVAAVYGRAWEAGSRAPTAAVQEAFKVSHSTAARWVGLARKSGHLAPTSQGRAGAANEED